MNIRCRALVGMTALLLAACAAAQPAGGASGALAYGSAGYVWNGMTPEQVTAMSLSGDAARGGQAYRGCQGCHRPNGAGRTDGVYPRLAGQHASVIVKQITDTRAGIRLNPKMAPFAAEHAVSLQEIADIAVFLAAARTAPDNGKGEAAAVPRGRLLYERQGCDGCHGKAGQGDPARLYPVVAAQHYAYLLREIEQIKAGARGNSHPDMVKSLQGLPPADLQALASHLAHLPEPRDAAR